MVTAKHIALALTVLVAILVTSCGSPATPAPAPAAPATQAVPVAAQPTTAPTTASAAPDAAKPKVAMLLEGTINDGGWNATGYKSLKKAETAFGLEVTYLEGVSVANVETALRDFCDKKYDLIMAHGSSYIDIALKVGKDMPNCHMAVSQGGKNSSNVVSYASNQSEACYLTGMLGAYMSKTGKLGYTSGMKIPAQVAALNAFREGAKSVKPDMEVLASFPGVWNDTEKGRQAALALMDAGVDFMMPRGDGIALGGIQACKERHVFCVGNTTDQWDLAPGLIIVSQMQDFSPYIKLMLADIKAGNFGNKNYSLGLKDGVMELSDFHGLVPADIAAKITDAIAKIKSGALVVKDDPTDHQ